MKIIVKLIAVLTFSQSAAFADCYSDFRSLVNKENVSLIDKRQIEIKSKEEFKKLSSPEFKAVENYINYLEFEFNGRNSLLISNKEYQNINQQYSSLGYKISVTDGGDESKVHYYIKRNDDFKKITYPILYRVWINQTPEKVFLCQTF